MQDPRNLRQWAHSACSLKTISQWLHFSGLSTPWASQKQVLWQLTREFTCKKHHFDLKYLFQENVNLSSSLNSWLYFLCVNLDTSNFFSTGGKQRFFFSPSSIIEGFSRSGALTHACNSNILGSWGGRITWGQEFKTSLTNMVKPHLTMQKNYPGMVVRACHLSHLGGSGRRIAWTWEAEVAVSWDCATTFQPGWQSETRL